MFTAERIFTELRQGDIIAGVFCPVVTCNAVLTGALSEPDDGSGALRVAPQRKLQGNREVYTTTHETTFHGYAMILSQCCDVSPRVDARIKVPGVGMFTYPSLLVSPLRFVEDSEATVQQRLEEIKDVTKSVGRMYVPPTHPLAKAANVDFCVISSITIREYPHLLRNKVLQMDDASRILLKRRMAMALTRLTDEEKAMFQAERGDERPG